MTEPAENTPPASADTGGTPAGTAASTVDPANPVDPVDTADTAPVAAGGRGRLWSLFWQIVAAGALGGVVTLAAWFVLRHVNLPAFSSSNVTKALASAAGIVVLAVLAAVVFRLLHPRGRSTTTGTGWRHTVAVVLCWLAPAGLVIAALGIPLSATRLYLDGISVDQAFRTQFLTRMTDSPGFGDMAYADMPSFYPRLWFLTGGIFAKIVGLSGWAAFQPWALVTLAASCSVLVPVWHRLTGSLPLGAVIATATTAVLLYTAPEEPYSAVVALGMPAALVLTGRAVRGSRPAILGLIVFLGLSANMYTLFTGVAALAVVVIAVAVAVQQRSWSPVLRLIVTGVGSGIIALIGWGPYLKDLLTSEHGSTGRAQHYLPESGTELPTPFFQASIVGVLGLLCIVWMVFRWRRRIVRSLAVGLIVCYAWVLLSMVAPLGGSTLLGFRMELPVALILVTGGMLALDDLRRHGVARAYPQFITREAAPKVTAVFAVLLTAATAVYVISVPQHLRDHIDLAYTDTDGDADRGDKMPADSTVYYADIDAALRDRLGDDPAASVVLTDEKNFLSYYPYHAYQAMTAHYANPLGQYEARNAEIEEWTKIDDPTGLTDAMDAAAADHGWQAPDALVLRGQLTDSGLPDGPLSYRMSDDIYPNDPNVRFRSVDFPAAAFDRGWDLVQVGPFVVAIRER
jgi:galactan 5-O-arabinofuranosyltransferase